MKLFRQIISVYKNFSLETDSRQIRTDGRVVADARSVLVAYDYGAESSVPLPEEIKRRLAAA